MKLYPQRTPAMKIPVPKNMYVVLIVVAILACMISVYQAEAQPNKFVSLIRSNVCEKTDCIKISDLIKYDNSTQRFSGKLVYSEKLGDYERKPGMKNSHEYYKIFSGKLFVFVEPDQTTLTRSKVIIIERKLPEYVTFELQKKSEIDFHTDRRITQFGMWFDPKCNSAVISANMTGVGSAISYLAGGCLGDPGNTKEIITKKAPRDYCGKECQHQKWMKESLIKSKKKLI